MKIHFIFKSTTFLLNILKAICLASITVKKSLKMNSVEVLQTLYLIMDMPLNCNVFHQEWYVSSPPTRKFRGNQIKGVTTKLILK